LCSLWGLWFFHTASGRHLVARALAQRFHTLAASPSDPNDRPVGEQMIGVSQQYLGDQSSARRHIERALTHYLTSDHGSAVIRFVFDQRVTTRVFLARILWLQGFPDQAIRAAESGIEDAQRTNHAASLCYALALAACPIALLVGDLAAAERYVGTLLDHSTRHALAHWRAIGRRYQGVLVMKQGDAVTGSRLLSVGFDELDEATPVLGFVAFLKAEALGHAGQVSEGLAAVDELIARSEHTEERWLIAGLLRIRGELLLLEGAPGRCCGRGSLPPRPRLGAPSRGFVLGTALRHEPRSIVARPGSKEGGA
jgi:hypothetical protein